MYLFFFILYNWEMKFWDIYQWSMLIKSNITSLILTALLQIGHINIYSMANKYSKEGKNPVLLQRNYNTMWMWRGIT